MSENLLIRVVTLLGGIVPENELALVDSDASCQCGLTQITHNHQQGDKLRAVWRPVP